MWRENMIKPIYKGGGTMDTNNYRGIAISSCFSKLFCKILFNRLDKYLEDNSIIGSEQIGFRKHCRTTKPPIRHHKQEPRGQPFPSR